MPKIGPEHALQVLVTKAVRAHVPQPHRFFSIDRSQATGLFTHVREKARGLVAGTPDTVLLYPGLPAIFIELKAKGRKVLPDSNQQKVGNDIRNAGHHWWWCDSVYDYLHTLQRFGVPLQGNWPVAAFNHDATLESAAIKREEAKTGTVSKRRYARKPPASKIKAVERIRSGVLF